MNLNKIKDSVIYAFDWPDIEGGNLTEQDYHKFKKLSFLFSSVASGTTAAIMESYSNPIANTIIAAAAMLFAGNYVAGKIVQRDVDQRKLKAVRDIFSASNKMEIMFGYIEKNLLGPVPPWVTATSQCLEKELIEEDEADAALILRQSNPSAQP